MTRPSTPITASAEEIQQDLKILRQNFETLRQKIEDNVSVANFNESYRGIRRDIDPCDTNGMTLIMHAARHGNVGIYQTLARDGANISAVNADGETALIIAANANNAEMANTIITDIATCRYVSAKNLMKPETNRAKAAMERSLANPNVQRCLNKQTAIFMAVILSEGGTKNSIMSQHRINQDDVDELKEYRRNLADEADVRDKIDWDLFDEIQRRFPLPNITGLGATRLDPSSTTCTIS